MSDTRKHTPDLARKARRLAMRAQLVRDGGGAGEDALGDIHREFPDEDVGRLAAAVNERGPDDTTVAVHADA